MRKASARSVTSSTVGGYDRGLRGREPAITGNHARMMVSEYEQRLLAFVADARELARVVNPEAAETLGRACAELSAAFADPDLQARYEVVLQLRRHYTLPVEKVLYPATVMDKPLELFHPTLELLQAYWRAMGREYHDPDAFPCLPAGSRVRMQRKALQSRDLMEGTETHVGWPASKGVWVVDERCGTDVDGVPLYWVEREDNWRDGTLVRQTALLPAGEGAADPGESLSRLRMPAQDAPVPRIEILLPDRLSQGQPYDVRVASAFLSLLAASDAETSRLEIDPHSRFVGTPIPALKHFFSQVNGASQLGIFVTQVKLMLFPARSPGAMGSLRCVIGGLLTEFEISERRGKSAVDWQIVRRSLPAQPPSRHESARGPSPG